MASHSAGALLALLCLLYSAPAWPEQAASDAAPSSARARPSAIELSDANTVALLASARDALFKLDNPPAGDGPGQPKIYFDTAADSFTALYQLHGCAWAVPELRRLYARPDAPLLRIGHSVDGRVLLRVEPLDLQNPVFVNHSVLLCTFGSQTARDIENASQGVLEITFPDGSWAGAQELTPQHPLWNHLQRLAGQFAPAPSLPSGAGVAWKQLYAVPRSRLPLNACALSLDWGGYHFDLPRWVDAPAGDGDG